MTDARADILARLRQGRREPVAAAPTPQSTAAGNLDDFLRGLEKVSASHETVSDKQQIGEAIERYLISLNAGHELVVTAAMHNLGVLNDSRLQLQAAPTRGNEASAVSLAYAGIAETGSLVMLSAADTPMSSNFLPDNFICVLETRHVLPDMEALWARMRREQHPMPRALNIITGPSRTADVEQVIQLGAHGPRRVHVILWDESA